MSTWQMFSDAGNNFRWEISNQCLEVKPKCESNASHIRSPSSDRCLPSMEDLLLEGCSKLLESRNEEVGNTPMFRTGLGKSVALKQSSIEKALAVLGVDDSTEKGQLQARNAGCFSNSFFNTGSGKTVNVSSEALIKAKTLLDLDLEEDNFHNGLRPVRKSHYNKKPSLEEERASNREKMEDGSVSCLPQISKSCSVECGLEGEVYPFLNETKLQSRTLKPPPIKFHTAGGRSISVSTDALQHARSLLGDPELGNFLSEADLNDTVVTVSDRKIADDSSLNNGNGFYTPSSCNEMAKSKHTSKSFVSPFSTSHVLHSSFESKHITGSNLMKKFDAVDHKRGHGSSDNISIPQKSYKNEYHISNASVDNLYSNSIDTRNPSLERSLGGPLVDVSNTVGTTGRNICSDKKRLWKTNSASPFKRPRNSKFATPLNKNVPFVTNECSPGPSTSSSEKSCGKRRVSTRYPHQASRVYIKEFFQMPLSEQKLKQMSNELRWIKSENAEKFIFQDKPGLISIGAEAFSNMLSESGASMQYASKLWVTNHYKWIIWKLACYEGRHPSVNFLTVSNVLEELKYRYEREVNHGHRSAIKRILEGDASPASQLVLCVSAIRSDCENSNGVKVELTDGWYAIDALLDGLLSKQLAERKLFVGQKLRIWGAGLCGWAGPVSPLEVPETVSFLLHINGTYRAHWAERLGFCKSVGAPLSFRCIKRNGGPVPWTLVGITRIYPILYKERLSDGGSVVRSERLEMKMAQLHDQRRCIVVDDVLSEFQRGMKSPYIYNESDSEEGARIFQSLEMAAEPEILMAQMSPEQLTSFATYQAKIEAIRQSDMEKSIQKALADAGLSERDVTPFMRVRVVGLISKNNQLKGYSKEGLITIWDPTEKQKHELVEGQAYAVGGLVPINCDSDILYLQGKGSTTNWQYLSSLSVGNFEPFFSPRKSILLSNLGEVPLSSEFDIVAVVVYVGEIFTAAHEKKQWVFVTDGSISELHSEEIFNSLLAINFRSPYVDDKSYVPININLSGSTVGFCNLIKRTKDHINHLWVAEATENSSYFLNFDTLHCSHLKTAAVSAERWAKVSNSTIHKLRGKILSIIGHCKG